MHGTANFVKKLILVFELSDRLFAFPAEDVIEIAHLPELIMPPGLPSFVCGFLNLQCSVVPVLRLSRLFDLPPEKGNLYAPVVMLRTRESLAILADRALDLIRVPEHEFVPVQKKNVFNDCVEAEWVYQGRAVHLLSSDRLLLSKEKKVLEEFRAIAARRAEQSLQA